MVLSQILNVHASIFFFLLTLSLGACVSKPDPAPVVERLPGSYSGISGDNVKDYERKEVYVVQSGDTLYGIALKNGLDVNQLAEMNDIADPERAASWSEALFTDPCRTRTDS